MEETVGNNLRLDIDNQEEQRYELYCLKFVGDRSLLGYIDLRYSCIRLSHALGEAAAINQL
jgi:hypothetical protein